MQVDLSSEIREQFDSPEKLRYVNQFLNPMNLYDNMQKEKTKLFKIKQVGKSKSRLERQIRNQLELINFYNNFIIRSGRKTEYQLLKRNYMPKLWMHVLMKSLLVIVGFINGH